MCQYTTRGVYYPVYDIAHTGIITTDRYYPPVVLPETEEIEEVIEHISPYEIIHIEKLGRYKRWF